MKKRILAFGDSNTWGYDPAGQPGAPCGRFADEVRWTGVLERALGDGYTVLNEGLNGRTTVFDDPVEEYRCGKHHIIPAIDTQAPIDLMIIMLGTNDLKQRFSATAHDIAGGARLLVERALARRDAFAGAPCVLLVCPPRLGNVAKCPSSASFVGGEEKSTQLDAHFRLVAEACGVGYLNADEIVRPSALDGVHLDADAHQRLGEAIARKISKMLAPSN